ncbi:MAG: hypothetical protein QOF62_729 [Pyrinomonadaceae bacterium]|jgi:hypothetical protein|nr:hypothetical protein [Pyrinomonadaceae bacterium]
MKRKILQSLTVTSLGLILSFTLMTASAQENNNTAKGEMKTSGSEVKRAGTSAGHDVKHGRLVRAGKHFGRHTGRAGRHFGRGTKKATKKVVKHVIS